MSSLAIYTLGGAVQAGPGIYLTRTADDALLEHCREGRYASILGARQIGKSSMVLRAARQLEAEGIRTAVVDLAQADARPVADQWCIGLLADVSDQLAADIDVAAWWRAQSRQGLVRRITLFFRQLLRQIDAPVVIFLDEIDRTRDLAFADDFYAAIRSLHSARARVADLSRLSFVLSGVAAPDDLVRDPRRSPFAIARPVELDDWSFAEALPLAAGLGLPPDRARRLLGWVIDWTAGHPYLTQRLCRAVAEQALGGIAGPPAWTEPEVAELVARSFLGQHDEHLRYVHAMLTAPAPPGILETYRAIVTGQPIPADAPAIARIELSGVVSRRPALQVRNRIYAAVFGPRWADEALSAAAAERQRRQAHAETAAELQRHRLESQLLQSEKLAAVGQLVAGVAHELNNPLTSISGYTQLLLRDSALGAEARDDLLKINIQAERAARIVRNLLLFAREHTPERRLIDLNEVVRDTLGLRAYQLRVDNIAVVLALDPGLPMTVADPFQFQQVVLNLINNAHQSMVERGGPGTLTLRTAADGATLRLSVGDTGVGIPAHELSRIFDPFYTTKPAGQGTGLGLAICYGIVQGHGGRIWAESQLAVGTIVCVELPLLSRPPVVEEPAPAPAARMRQLGALAVLIVDDEEPVAVLIARLVNDFGHRALMVTSAAQALAALAQQRFDLLIVDVKMPGMSGFDLYEALSGDYPDLARRVVFVTGDTLSSATMDRLRALGQPYLTKPFTIEHFALALQALAGPDAPPSADHAEFL